MARFILEELRIEEVKRLHSELNKVIGEYDVAFKLRSHNPTLSPSLIKQHLLLSPIYVTKVKHGYHCVAGARSYFIAKQFLDDADNIPVIIDTKRINLKAIRDQFLMECLYQSSFSQYLDLVKEAKKHLVQYVETLSDEDRAQYFIDSRERLAETLDYSTRTVSRAKS